MCRKPQGSGSVPHGQTAKKLGEDLAIIQECPGARQRAQKPVPRVPMFGSWLCYTQRCHLPYSDPPCASVSAPTPRPREMFPTVPTGDVSKRAHSTQEGSPLDGLGEPSYSTNASPFSADMHRTAWTLQLETGRWPDLLNAQTLRSKALRYTSLVSPKPPISGGSRH